jgi:hypothetical protein
MYFTWAAMESCSSVGRDEGMPARPGPDTSDICKAVDPVDLEDEDEDVSL